MRLRATTLVVLGLALVATAAAAWATQAAHDDGEERLLDQRLDEAAVVLAGLVPRLTAPLAAAAELAEATEGGRASFERVLSPQVGPDAPFVSVSLWSLAEPDQPVTVVGDQPVLADQGGGETAAFLERSAGTDDVTVIGLLEGPSPVIGLSYTSSTREPTFVIYAEAPVPEDRTAVRQEDALFADLDYALYLGEEASTANLLGTSRELPLPTPTAAAGPRPWPRTTPGSTPISAASPTPSSTASCPSSPRARTAWRSPPTTSPGWTGPRSGGTGTTWSTFPVAASSSWSATSRGVAFAPPPSWPCSATPPGPTRPMVTAPR